MITIQIYKKIMNNKNVGFFVIRQTHEYFTLQLQFLLRYFMAIFIIQSAIF